MAISKYLERIKEDFIVYGFPFKGGDWEEFKRNKNYKGFIFQRKIE